MNEDKYAKQILNIFSDLRLNTSHLAWMVRLAMSKPIDNNIKEFFYYYSTFEEQDIESGHKAAMGAEMMKNISNPAYEGLDKLPPPGTRIVFDYK